MDSSFQRFFLSYLECCVWSTCDDDGNPLDDSYDVDDIAPEAQSQAEEECLAFWEDNLADLESVGSPESHGHDFSLTRNGHGAGFWDRGYGDVGQRLTDASKPWGEAWLYPGDDGRLYFS